MSDWEAITLESQWELLEMEDIYFTAVEAEAKIPQTNGSATAVDEPKAVETKSEDQGPSSEEELLPAAAVTVQKAITRKAPEEELLPAAEDDYEFPCPPPPIPEFVHRCPGCNLVWVQTEQSYCYKCTAILSQRARIQNERCCPISQNNWHCKDKVKCSKMPVQFR